MNRNVQLESIEVVVPKGRTLRVRGGSGFEVRVAHGTAWITEQGCVTDTVVTGGESCRLERKGLALVFALQEVRLTIYATGALKVPAIQLGGGYREISSMIVNAMIADAATRMLRRARSMLAAVVSRAATGWAAASRRAVTRTP